MSEKKETLMARLFFVAAIVGGGVLVAFAFSEIGYYELPMHQRALHPSHALLRPSSRLGLGFGIAGIALMFLNLSYLIRKHLPARKIPGTLRTWMAFHVFTGLMAVGLVLLHAAFRPQSPLGALSFWAILIVLVSGVVGRYLYSYVPRTLEGRELKLEEIRVSLSDYRKKSAELGPILDSLKLSMDPAIYTDGSRRGIFGALQGLSAGVREMRGNYRRLRAAVLASEATRRLAPRILPLAERYCREHQWLLRYRELHLLMGTWRFSHRWFSIIMLIMTSFHILVNLRHGDISFSF